MATLAALRNFGTAAAVNDNTLVHVSGAETIGGAKTFTSTVTGSATEAFRTYNNGGYYGFYNGSGVRIGYIQGNNAAAMQIANEATNQGINFTMNGTGQLTRASNVIWDAGNDGAGSGLDADLLDGLQASAFGQVGGPNTWTADQTFGGIVFITSNQPDVRYRENDAGADAKNWWTYVLGGVLNFHTVNDAFTVSNAVYTVSRSGALATVWEFFNVDLRIVVAPGGGLATNSAGFRSAGPNNTKTGSYTFVQTDEGRATDSDTGSAHAFTINTGVHTDNAVLFGANRNTGVMTLTAGAGVTFRDSAGGTTNPTVSQYQQWSARRQGSTNTWFVRVF